MNSEEYWKVKEEEIVKNKEAECITPKFTSFKEALKVVDATKELKLNLHNSQKKKALAKDSNNAFNELYKENSMINFNCDKASQSPLGSIVVTDESTPSSLINVDKSINC